MNTRFILEDGLKMTRYKQQKLVENFNSNKPISLPDNAFVKSIQGISDGTDHVTIVIIGRM